MLPQCPAAVSTGPTALEIVNAVVPNAASGFQLRWDAPALERSYSLKLEQVGASTPTYIDRTITWANVDVDDGKATHTVTGLAAGRWAAWSGSAAAGAAAQALHASSPCNHVQHRLRCAGLAAPLSPPPASHLPAAYYAGLPLQVAAAGVQRGGDWAGSSVCHTSLHTHLPWCEGRAGQRTGAVVAKAHARESIEEQLHGVHCLACACGAAACAYSMCMAAGLCSAAGCRARRQAAAASPERLLNCG